MKWIYTKKEGALTNLPLVPFLFVLLGLFVLHGGLALGVGVEGLPGAGLWPAIVGAALFVGGVFCALRELWASFTGARGHADQAIKANLLYDMRLCLRGPLGGMLFACILWLVLVPLVGCFVGTALAMLAACRMAGALWREVFWLTLGLTLTLYLGAELLNSPLPQGLLFSVLEHGARGVRHA